MPKTSRKPSALSDQPSVLGSSPRIGDPPRPSLLTRLLARLLRPAVAEARRMQGEIDDAPLTRPGSIAELPDYALPRTPEERARQDYWKARVAQTRAVRRAYWEARPLAELHDALARRAG